MKNLLVAGDIAPSFTTKDILGNDVSSFQNDKWIFLSFHRFAACPFCTLRTHELMMNYQMFCEMNIEIISVWPSSNSNMLKFIGSETSPFSLVSDVDKEIYQKYKVSKSSFLGMLTTMMHPKIVVEALKGLYKNTKVDADPTLLPADFLIDPNGKIELAYYGKHFGDHVPIKQLFSLVSKMSRGKVFKTNGK